MLEFAPRLLVNEWDCKATPTSSQQKSEAVPTFSKMGIDRENLFSRIMEAFGSRTAANLAEKLNITRQSVYGWRDGKNLPELDKLLEISNVTNTSLHWLITGEGSKGIETGQDEGSLTQAERLLKESSLPEIFTHILNRLEVLEAKQIANNKVYPPEGDESAFILAREKTSEETPTGDNKRYKR
jgi:transcriptional regulator with XRE-family HTH domain